MSPEISSSEPQGNNSDVHCYLRFRTPPLSDITHLPVSERSQWLKDHFEQCLETLAPWLHGIALLDRFDYLLSAVIAGSPEACARLRSYLESTGKGSLSLTDAVIPQMESVPATHMVSRAQQELADKPCPKRESLRALSWIPTWLKIGKEDPRIQQASDPAFNTQSFHRCDSDTELLDKFQSGSGYLGQAFYLGDLCFINQVGGGDEWLTIKQGATFESIAFGRVIREQGREAAQEIVDRIKATAVEKGRQLKY